MLFCKLIVEVPEVGNTADTPNPLGIYPFKRKLGRAKENLAQVGFEPTTSALDLLMLRVLCGSTTVTMSHLSYFNVSQN